MLEEGEVEREKQTGGKAMGKGKAKRQGALGVLTFSLFLSILNVTHESALTLVSGEAALEGDSRFSSQSLN